MEHRPRRGDRVCWRSDRIERYVPIAHVDDPGQGPDPHPEALDYLVKITIDGRDSGRVDDALAWLAARLGDAVVRTD